MKEISIRLGIKDNVIRAWWEGMSSEQINISKTINHAVEYYVATGNFVNIATIDKVPEYPKSVMKKCYLPETSASYQWLLSRKNAGVDISSSIKRILRNSIRIGSTAQYSSVDELMQIVETLEIIPKPASVSVQAEERRPVKVIQTEPVKEVTNKPVKEEKPATMPSTPRFMQKESAEVDLFDMMLGDNKLSL